MKKKVALLLLLVGCLLEAKSFRSSSSSSRSFSRPSSSSRSSSSSFRSSSSSSSGVRSSSSSSSTRSTSSSSSRVTNVRPSSSTTKTTNSSKTSNNTTIINNNTNVNNSSRGGGVDVLDVILLNSVLNNSRPREVHHTETVYVEKSPVVQQIEANNTENQIIEQRKEVTTVTKRSDSSSGFVKVLGFIAICLLFILLIGVFL